MYCRNCGQQIDDNAYVCVHCGVRTSDDVPLIKPEPVYCVYCGKMIDANAYMCVHCGKIVAKDTEPVQSPVQVTKRPAKQPGKIYGILGIVFSALSLVLIGVILSIIGMTRAMVSGNSTSKKINIAAICVSASVCLFEILFFVLDMSLFIL